MTITLWDHQIHDLWAIATAENRTFAATLRDVLHVGLKERR